MPSQLEILIITSDLNLKYDNRERPIWLSKYII